MTNRTLLAAAAGFGITIGLILVMQLLITTGEEVVEQPRERINLSWLKESQPEEIVVEPTLPDRIDPPQLPPETAPNDISLHDGPGIGVSAPPPVPQPGTGISIDAGITDGPLINILKVEPQYPAAAAVKGIEGLVVVQFDITAAGTVENVVVVESTDRVFNRAAVAAASQFKYKPRIVDGVPRAVQGVQQKFRFDLKR